MNNLLMYLIVLVGGGSGIGDIGETMQNVLTRWLDYTPTELHFTVLIEPKGEPNILMGQHWDLGLSVGHLRGGYGIAIVEPNGTLTHINFQRFKWAVNGHEASSDKSLILKGVKLSACVIINPDIPYIEKYYDLEAINEWVFFQDPRGRSMVIVFRDIKWSRVNMKMYAEAAKGR